jgi:hypothetical protein
MAGNRFWNKTSDDALFKSFIAALTDKQLDALAEWQAQRMSGYSVSNFGEVVSDAIKKKRLIYAERRRRDHSGSG